MQKGDIVELMNQKNIFMVVFCMNLSWARLHLLRQENTKL